MVMQQKTIFFKAKHKYLGDMISLKSPALARISVIDLKQEFKDAQTNDKKLRIARATMLASNRAKVILKKKGLSLKERTEFRQILSIYKKVAEDMFRKLR